jgi:hypothetical protein
MVIYQSLLIFAVMGRKKHTVPNRIRHRPSGQDRIVWRGKSIYLGKSGTPEAEANYRRVVRSIMDTGEPFVKASSVTVRFLADRFMVATKESFPPESREPIAYQRAMTLLTEALGDEPADAITPARFAAMRDLWAKSGKSLRTINKHHNMILSAFRWGVTVELIPAAVWHALQAVARSSIGSIDQATTRTLGAATPEKSRSAQSVGRSSHPGSLARLARIACLRAIRHNPTAVPSRERASVPRSAVGILISCGTASQRGLEPRTVWMLHKRF